MPEHKSAREIAGILTDKTKSFHHVTKKVSKLVRKGHADINQQDGDTGKAVLHYLCEMHANPELIYFCLTALKADPNIHVLDTLQDGSPNELFAGYTPLHFLAFSATNHYLPVNTANAAMTTAILVAHGANINMIENNGHTPLDIYVDQANHNVSSHSNLNASSIDGAHYIAGALPLLKTFYDLGAEFQSLSGYHNQYIIAAIGYYIDLAVSAKNETTLAVLSQKGANELMPIGSLLRRSAMLPHSTLYLPDNNPWMQLFYNGALRAGALKAAKSIPESFGHYTALYESLDPELCELAINIQTLLPDELKLHIASFLQDITPKILADRSIDHLLDTTKNADPIPFPYLRQQWVTLLDEEKKQEAPEDKHSQKSCHCICM